MEKKTIGGFIAALRRASGMTQKELGEKLGVSDKAVSRWERDECAPDLTLIPVLAEIFGVTSDEILRGQRLTGTDTGIAAQVRHTEKQIAKLLSCAQVKLSNRSIISMGIAVAGLLAAMICNFGFNRAYIGFFTACIFYAAACVCQSVFTISAFNSVSGEPFESDDVNACKYAMARTAFRPYCITAVLLAFTLPLIMLPFNGYVGLEGGALLRLGVSFAAVMLWITVLIRPAIFCAFEKHGVVTMSEQERKTLHTLNSLAKNVTGISACVLIITILFNFITVNGDATKFADGTVFESFDDFKEFMETPVEAMWDGSSALETPVTYYNQYGNEISEDEALSHEMRDGNGNVIGTYIWRNNSVATINYSSITAEGFRVTVYTQSDVQRGTMIKSSIQSVFYVVYIAEAVVAAAVYIALRRKITRSQVDK